MRTRQAFYFFLLVATFTTQPTMQGSSGEHFCEKALAQPCAAIRVPLHVKNASKAFQENPVDGLSGYCTTRLYVTSYQSISWPQLTCFSRELMTFRCRWDTGSFQNLTEPGDMRLFYMLEKDSKKGSGEWRECPNYSITRQNECFFNATYTIIWHPYAIQLRSRTQDFVYDEKFFTVEEIVLPDPPELLNWTLLRMGSTGLICDVVVSWEPPPSAADNVKTGWMLLLYETQYREKGSELWKYMDTVKDTRAYIYGLNTSTQYEVRVRSKMRGYNFGEYSDSIFILVPSRESRIPLTALFIFAAISIGIIMILIVVSRQQKFMVIFLPPVPGPKIKGIDPVLLQKGQLTDLASILDTHPGLRPELYSNDPWVEFIEVDIEEASETLEGFETSLLIGDSPVSDSPLVSSGFRDDDSGRASCCDPDLSDHDHSDIHHPSSSGHEGFHALSPGLQPGTSRPVIIHPAGKPAWPNSLYSQVSDVTPHGVAVLSPEKQNMTDDCSNQDNLKHEKNKEEKKPQLMAAPNERGYTSELEASKISALHTEGEPSEPSSPSPESSTSSGEQRHDALQEHMSPTVEAEITPFTSAFPILAVPTPPEYTMVDGVNWENSLLLKPNKPAALPLAVVKAPEGYLTPDLLHSITP